VAKFSFNEECVQVSE